MTNSQHRIAVSRPGRRAGRRRLLLASTALTAALLAPSQGRAGQPAPMTTPQGGTVVGGSATISQAPGTTTITQTSQRAAIDWQSFNLGSKARVTFNQPNAQAIALNRVIANNPSIIAGRIDANGRIVLVNQDGVVFTPGSEVNAESLVVSTSGISPKNFMAGKLIFDQQPKPGARIVNDGRITMKQAGLAAFVAPEVINRGTITAQLGHVVLAGASAFTLNLSGDGLISINVTQAVRQIDLGGRKVTALVTNEGTIIANGGRITLTARAVDGLIQQLLDVGGTLRADSVGRQPGAITIQGVGGDLQVAGQLLARGETPGSSGGTIAVDATGNVSVASTARIDASGPAGGGVVALGTDAARALQGPSDTTAPKAARVAIAQGATISADATRNGNGGRITVLSRDRTTAAGTISAQGAGNGDGGLIEISSDGVISLSGTDTTFAPSGRNGTILLDPQTLIVTASGGTPSAGTTTTSGTLTVGTDSSTSSYIDASILDSQTGAVELSASSLISIVSAISSSSISTLAMNSGGDIRIAAPVTLTAGSIEATANGTIEVSGALGASSISLLDTASSPTNKIDINANIDAQTLSLDASGGTISNSGSGTGYINASSLDIVTASSVILTGSNSITTLGSVNVGNLTLDDNAPLTIAGPFTATSASLTDTSAGGFDITGAVSATGSLSLDANAGTISNSGSGTGYINASSLDIVTASSVILTGSNSITTLGSVNVGNLTLDDNAPLTIAGPFTATSASLTDTSAGGFDITGAVSATGSLSLDANAGTISNSGSGTGYINASSLDIVTASSVVLTGSNSITTLEDFVANSITLVDQSALTLAGTVSVATHGQVAFITRGLDDTSGATFLAPDGTIEIAPLGSSTIAGTLDLGGTSAGNVNVSTNFVTLLADSGAALLDLGTANAGTGTLAGGVIFDGNLPSFTPTLMVEASGSIVNRTILQAGTGTFSGGSIVNDGVLSVGNITVTGSDFSGSGAVTADSLAGSVSGFASLQNGGNSIKVITSLSAGSSIDVADSQPLTIAGALSAGSSINVADSQSLNIAGTLSVASGGNIVLSANGMDLAGGTILANSGAVTLAPLSFDTIALGGTSTTALDLSNQLLNAIGANSLQIGTVQTGLIENDGSISLSIPNILMDAGTININQPFLAQHSSLIVQAGGEFTGNGGITVAALGAAASLVALTGSNSITTLGSISAAGSFTLDDNAPLTIAGPFTATNASITNTGSLDITGSFNATDASLAASDIRINANLDATTLSLDANAGTITNAGSVTGYVTASNLDATASLVALTGSNAITTLGSISAGSFTLDDNAPLTIAGPFNATDASLAASDIRINANLDATILSLDAGSGTIANAGSGYVNATTLDAAASLVALTGSNAITTLGSINVGNFTLDDNAPITIAGPFNATSASFTDTSAGGFDIAGQVSLASLLALSATGGSITSSGTGSISAPTLDATASLVALTGSNSITTLGSINVGSFTLDDNAPLTIAGPFTATNASLTDTSAGGFDIAAQVSLASLLALSATSGSITSSGTGSISAPTLDAAASLVALTGSNSITTLGSINVGTLTLDDEAAALTIAGSFNATSASITNTGSLTIAGSFNATDASLAASDIRINANLDATTLSLDANGGTITNAGSGYVNATTLDAVASLVALTGSNAITTLGNVSAGSFTLDDNAPLTVAGPFTATNASLTDTSAGGFDIAGQVSLASLLALSATSGSITSSGTGSISAPTLDAAASLVALTGSNAVTTLGSINVGTLTLDDEAAALTIAGPFNVTDARLTDTGSLDIASAVSAIGSLGLAASNIGINASLDATILSLDAGSGTIANAGSGYVNATTLDAAASLVALTGSNAITTLGSINVGSFTLDDNAPLTIAGPFTATNASLTDTSAGGFDIAGQVSLASLLALSATGGSITSSGTGSISAPTLDATASLVALTGSNSITTLGSISAGNFTLDDNAPLTIAGPFNATSASLTDTSGGGLDIAGQVSLASLLALSATSGSITSSGTGSISAPTLDAAASLVALTGSNVITTLGSINVGTFTLDDNAPLTIAGSLIAQRAAISAADLTIPGVILVDGALSLATSGTISETGTIDPTLLQIAGARDVLLTGSNTIDALGSVSVPLGNLALVDQVPLTVNGPVYALNISLDSPAIYIPGAINTPGTLGLGYGPISGNGPITAATLTSNSAVIGDVALTGTENVIGTLGGFDAAGHLFALTDATALTVAGPVSAKALTITATGQITLDGADGGSFSIGGQFLPTYVYNGLSPRNGIDSVLQVIANGAPANGIVQTGQFNIDTGSLQGQPNTLFMLLPDGADAKFNDLNARSTDLAISLINGYAQGTLYLHYLLVAGGLNGQTAFVGQIAGLAGSAAAHNGKVVPVPGSSYRFNSCIIGSVSCTVLPVAIVPERNPLDDFDISPRRRRKLDANVRLPGVAAKDY